MLDEKDRGVRRRAVAALARLSECHPARLLRVMPRLREAMADDSAYVRWHLAYTFGKLGVFSPVQSRGFLADLILRLDDENRVVRDISCKAITQIAVKRPLVIEESFQNLKKEIPSAVARILRISKSRLSE
jgi:HEAT repeat protein